MGRWGGWVGGWGWTLKDTEGCSSPDRLYFLHNRADQMITSAIFVLLLEREVTAVEVQVVVAVVVPGEAVV